MSDYYPPMSGRAFRDQFMIEDRTGEGGNLREPKSANKWTVSCGSGVYVHERTPECTGAADCRLGVPSAEAR